jgi:hypothetical protein
VFSLCEAGTETAGIMKLWWTKQRTPNFVIFFTLHTLIIAPLFLAGIKLQQNGGGFQEEEPHASPDFEA